MSFQLPIGLHDIVLPFDLLEQAVQIRSVLINSDATPSQLEVSNALVDSLLGMVSEFGVYLAQSTQPQTQPAPVPPVTQPTNGVPVVDVNGNTQPPV